MHMDSRHLLNEYHYRQENNDAIQYQIFYVYGIQLYLSSFNENVYKNENAYNHVDGSRQTTCTKMLYSLALTLQTLCHIHK